MEQMTFAELERDGKKRKTRRFRRRTRRASGTRGLAKNTQRIAMLLGFANLLIAGRYAAA